MRPVPAGRAVLRLIGELDLFTAPRLAGAFGGVLEGGARHPTLDLAELGFLDRAGLRALVEARVRLQAAEGELFLAFPSLPPVKLLEISSLTEVLTIIRRTP